MFQRYIYQNPMFAPFEPGRNIFIQIAIRFYSLRFHFIVIPPVIIYAAIHLALAIRYFGECPIEPLIVIYMIVHASVHLGLIILVFIGVIIVQCIYSRNQTIGTVIIIIVLFLQTILVLFNLAWIIAGSVWIFGAKVNGVQGDNPNMTNTYCQSHLYRAAFTLLIINYVLHVLLIIGIIAIYIWRKNRRTKSFNDIPINVMNYKL